jgi:hypothetical protein
VSEKGSAGGSASAAAEKVRAILEAAEESAAALRAEAAQEIEAQLARAQAVAERLSARAEEIERALEGLAENVRSELSALKADLEELRAVGEGMAEVREEAAASEPAPAEPEPTIEMPSKPPEEGAGDGHEGARVIALNMALGGTSREDTARYLAENFDLEDPEALLDEVYARVSG